MLFCLTNHWLQNILQDSDKLLVNLNGQVTQYLSIFSKVKICEAMFILTRSVVLHKSLHLQKTMCAEVCSCEFLFTIYLISKCSEWTTYLRNKIHFKNTFKLTSCWAYQQPLNSNSKIHDFWKCFWLFLAHKLEPCLDPASVKWNP